MDAWTVGRMRSWMEGYLSDHGDADPRISTRWLLSGTCGLSFTELYTNADRPLSASELAKLREHVKRRAAGEPVQYIVGRTAFRHIDVIVRDGVLIPRPETEVLVSEVLARLPRDRHASGDAPPEPDVLVADLCTGSGCIACSLAYENPRIRVMATDIAPECASLARENARALGLDERVEVIECDMGEGVDPSLLGTFDAVVANPPYVPTDVLQTLPDEVLGHEPRLALDGGADGLDAFRRIAAWAKEATSPEGFLAAELHETTLDDAAALARDAGFPRTRIVADLAGLPRVLVAHKMAEEGSEGDD